jgi:plastocyanin
MKKIIILLIVISLLGLGCTTQDTTDQDEQVPVNGEDNQSAEDIQPAEDVDEEDNVSEANDTELEEYTPKTHYILINSFYIGSKVREINRTDTVVWRNQKKEPGVFTLKSEDGLWEDQRIPYGRTFKYTFNETGNYSFYIPPYSGLNMTIMVK